MKAMRSGWWFVEIGLAWVLMLGAAAAVPGTARAQSVPTTRVQDTVFRADGTAASGTVLVSWPAFTTAGGSSVPAGSTPVTIGTGGSLTVNLAPNAGSTPIGSYYTVVYHLDDGSVTREYWVVPAQAGAATVGAIKSSVLPASVAMQTVSKSYVDTAIAAAVTGHPQDSPVNPYVLKAGDTMTGPLVLPADPTAPLQASDKQYVDAQVAGLAAGISQKVSTLPAATQTVIQPTGTELAVNRLNNVEQASLYGTPGGNNGIANATASPDCASGCAVVVDPLYPTAEHANPESWNNQTHVEDQRRGATFESFLNPLPPDSLGVSAAKSIHVVSTQDVANILATTGVPGNDSVGLAITSDALAGGSNVYPSRIQGTIPYFKTTFSAQSAIGTNYTIGQHILNSQSQDCYGVGDCLMGGLFMRASGGFRDNADEGSHPFDQNFVEDDRVFEGTCSSGCSTGSTSVQVAVTANGGTQGEGRYLIDLNPAKTIHTGTLTGGLVSGRQPSATFSGTSFPVSTLLETAQVIPTQAQNIQPGTVTVAIVTSGAPAGFATSTAALPASSGVACVSDVTAPTGQALNFETAAYSVVDSSHVQLTLVRPHATGATLAVGGLCGYGLEQTVDTVNGIRQVFPVIASTSATSLLYAGGPTSIVGQTSTTSAYTNVNLVIASIARNSNVVTLTTAGNFTSDLNGLTLAVQGVTDTSYNGSFVVTTTGPNSLTYAETGANSTSAGGTLSLVTGGFVLYPEAEALSVYNTATKAVDGLMTLAANTVAWAAGDAVEMPHYFEEQVHPDTVFIAQTTPRPPAPVGASLVYQGNNGPGLVGWQLQNADPASSYFGNGGTHTVPGIGVSVVGAWRHTMELTGGEDAAIEVHCNSHGCDKWNSGYDLFQMDTSVGVDRMNYSPATSTLNFSLRGTNYQFTPSGLTVGTLNVTALNVGTINGSAPGTGSALTEPAIAAAISVAAPASNFALGIGAATSTYGTVPDGTPYGYKNLSIGEGAGSSETTTNESVAIGWNALHSLTGPATTSSDLNLTENGDSVGIGSEALEHMVYGAFTPDGTGSSQITQDNTAVGQKAGVSATYSFGCSLFGAHAGAGVGTCSGSSVFGAHSLNDGAGGNTTNTAVLGEGSLNGSGAKDQDTILGASIGPAATTPVADVIGGYLGTFNLTTGSHDVVFGASAGPGVVAGSYDVIVGDAAGPAADDSSDIWIGASAGNGVTTAANSTMIGTAIFAHGGTISQSVGIGDSIAYGGGALNWVRNTVVGSQAGQHVNASDQTIFGAKAGISVSSGIGNTFVGSQTGQLTTTGNNNTAVGNFAGNGMGSGDSNNEAYGYNATTGSGVTNAAQIGGGTNAVSGSLQFNSTQIVDGQQNLHASVGAPLQGSTCTAGAIVVNSGFVYVCVAANTWQRAVLNAY